MNPGEQNSATNSKPFHKINKFYIGGFKAFKNNQEVPIRPITLVFGPNSSGKSSLLKGLLFSLDIMRSRIQDVGRPEDLVNKLSNKSTFGFEFNTKVDNLDVLPRNISLEDRLEWLSNFEHNYANALKDPSNYQFIKSSTNIELSAIPYGSELKLKHFENNSVNVIEESYSIFSDNMPLSIEIQGNQIKAIESKFKDLLIDSIILNFKNCELSEAISSFLINCINEEILSMAVRFDPSSGRILISKFSSNTQWYKKCLSELNHRFLTSIEEQLKNKVEGFNNPNKLGYDWQQTYRYFDPKNTKKYNLDVFGTISHYKNIGENPFSLSSSNRLKSKNRHNDIAYPSSSLTPIDGSDEFRIHDNTLIGFSLVYDAVLAIISDINIRYANAFCSLTVDQSPKVKYISASRSFLDDQGKPNSLWNNLISNPQNRQKTNKWLKQLTEHFQISEPSRMFSEAQAIILQNGAAKIGDEGLNPIVDNELRITDIRIPSTSFRPQDVGFGIQKLVPVIAAAVHANPLTSADTESDEIIDIVAIEEPEMHLHPKLQSDLGDLFVDNVINNSEKIFIIETHSEHLLLRILKRVRDGDLSSDAVSVLYVHPGSIGSGAFVEHLELDEDGEFLKPWPPGFFDVRRKNLI